MPDPNQDDPTAGYKPAPKGGSFSMVVALAAAPHRILLAIALLVAKHKATKVDPHTPHPTPNATLRQRVPARHTERLQQT